jgi:hypothetical protein
MLRRTLGRIFTRIGEKLAPKPNEPLSPTEQWLKKVKADFKKRRLINPSTGRLDLRFNPLSMDEDINIPIRDEPGQYYQQADPSEELAFLEWMEEKGIKLPKKDILRNDDKWHGLDVHFNPLDCDEDFFIPHRDVA